MGSAVIEAHARKARFAAQPEEHDVTVAIDLELSVGQLEVDLHLMIAFAV